MEKERQLMVDFVLDIMELFQYQEFVLRQFYNDILYAFYLLAETVNAIEMRYGCFKFRSKTKLHKD